jgi:hypothetical protein
MANATRVLADIQEARGNHAQAELLREQAEKFDPRWATVVPGVTNIPCIKLPKAP